MTLTAAEVDSLRFHLGYGNIGVAAEPYTPDGFYEVFSQIISPNLSVSTETTASLPATITAGTNATLTLAAVTLMTAYTRLVIDVGPDVEIVQARAVSGLTVTAKFALAHVAPFPMAVLSGVARLRLLLHAADMAWQKEHGPTITGTAGIKQLGKGEIEYFPGGAVLADVSGQYAVIQHRISALVRVPIAGGGMRRGSSALEAY